MFKIENETDLNCKVVKYIRRFSPETIIVAGLGENQDTKQKRINSWKKGYMNGQPDILIVNNHMRYNGLYIEFKSPTNHYQVSNAQLDMTKRFKENGFRFVISSDYDIIIRVLNNYMGGIRVPRQNCSKQIS